MAPAVTKWRDRLGGKYRPQTHAFTFALGFLLNAGVACLALHVGRLRAENDEAIVTTTFRELGLPLADWVLDQRGWHLIAITYFIVGALSAMFGIYGVMAFPTYTRRLHRFAVPFATFIFIVLSIATFLGIGFRDGWIVFGLMAMVGIQLFLFAEWRKWLRDQPDPTPT